MNTMMNLLKENEIYNEMYLTFKNGELTSHRTDNEKWNNDGVVNDLLTTLKKLEMVTFWDDVPNMTISVPIWGIDDTDELYIETFHTDDDDEENYLHDRGMDTPMKLEIFKTKVFENY